MSISNNGQQIITYGFKQEATSINFNNFNPNVFGEGVYSGGAFSYVDNTTIHVAPFILFIRDYIYLVGVRVETTENAVVTVAPEAQYVIARYSYRGISINYLDIFATSSDNIQDSDIILGKVMFNGTVLINEFDYSRKEWSNYYYANLLTNSYPLKVVANEPYDTSVTVLPGQVFFSGELFTLSTATESPDFTFPIPGGGRKDILCLNNSGVMEIITNGDTTSPSINQNRYPLAIIDFPYGATVVQGNYINFLPNTVYASPEIDTAEILPGYTRGNASGNVPLSNGTLNTNLNTNYINSQEATKESDSFSIMSRDSNGECNVNELNIIREDLSFDFWGYDKELPIGYSYKFCALGNNTLAVIYYNDIERYIQTYEYNGHQIYALGQPLKLADNYKVDDLCNFNSSDIIHIYHTDSVTDYYVQMYTFNGTWFTKGDGILLTNILSDSIPTVCKLSSNRILVHCIENSIDKLKVYEYNSGSSTWTAISSITPPIYTSNYKLSLCYLYDNTVIALEQNPTNGSLVNLIYNPTLNTWSNSSVCSVDVSNRPCAIISLSTPVSTTEIIIAQEISDININTALYEFSSGAWSLIEVYPAGGYYYSIRKDQELKSLNIIFLPALSIIVCEAGGSITGQVVRGEPNRNNSFAIYNYSKYLYSLNSYSQQIVSNASYKKYLSRISGNEFILSVPEQSKSFQKIEYNNYAFYPIGNPCYIDTIGNMTNPCFISITSEVLLYIDEDDKLLRTFIFDGINWNQVSTSTYFSSFTNISGRYMTKDSISIGDYNISKDENDIPCIITYLNNLDNKYYTYMYYYNLTYNTITPIGVPYTFLNEGNKIKFALNTILFCKNTDNATLFGYIWQFYKWDIPYNGGKQGEITYYTFPYTNERSMEAIGYGIVSYKDNNLYLSYPTDDGQEGYTSIVIPSPLSIPFGSSTLTDNIVESISYNCLLSFENNSNLYAVTNSYGGLGQYNIPNIVLHEQVNNNFINYNISLDNFSTLYYKTNNNVLTFTGMYKNYGNYFIQTYEASVYNMSKISDTKYVEVNFDPGTIIYYKDLGNHFIAYQGFTSAPYSKYSYFRNENTLITVIPGGNNLTIATYSYINGNATLLNEVTDTDVLVYNGWCDNIVSQFVPISSTAFAFFHAAADGYQILYYSYNGSTWIREGEYYDSEIIVNTNIPIISTLLQPKITKTSNGYILTRVYNIPSYYCYSYFYYFSDQDAPTGIQLLNKEILYTLPGYTPIYEYQYSIHNNFRYSRLGGFYSYAGSKYLTDMFGNTISNNFIRSVFIPTYEENNFPELYKPY